MGGSSAREQTSPVFPQINKSFQESSPELQVEKEVFRDDVLFIHKEKFFKSKMIVTLKLKNIELWVMDYKGEPNSKAQILQLKFMSDIVYDNDGFGKQLFCSIKAPKSKHLASHVEEEAEEKFIVETRNLRSESYTLVNLNHLSIDQLIVQRWVDVQHIVSELHNHREQKDDLVDYEDINNEDDSEGQS